MQWWKILGIRPDASEKEIKRAYSTLIKQYRPHEHPEEFSKIRQAYEIATKATSSNKKKPHISRTPESSRSDTRHSGQPFSYRQNTYLEPNNEVKYNHQQLLAFNNQIYFTQQYLFNPWTLKDIRPSEKSAENKTDTIPVDKRELHYQDLFYHDASSQPEQSDTISTTALEQEINDTLTAWAANRYDESYIDSIISHKNMDAYYEFTKISEYCMKWFADNQDKLKPKAFWRYHHILKALTRLNTVFNWEHHAARLYQLLGEKIEAVLDIINPEKYQISWPQPSNNAKWFMMFLIFFTILLFWWRQASTGFSISTLYVLPVLAWWIDWGVLKKRYSNQLLSRAIEALPASAPTMFHLAIHAIYIIILLLLISFFFALSIQLIYMLLVHVDESARMYVGFLYGILSIYIFQIIKRLSKILRHQFICLQYKWVNFEMRSSN